ncbi:unnamed protein product, partial [marine sediment metagenome]
METASTENIDRGEAIAALGGKPKIAYFSMEMGIDERMPTYSGGLG